MNNPGCSLNQDWSAIHRRWLRSIRAPREFVRGELEPPF
jgi:hypothetical protein